jgi:hypothetical protein
MLFLINLESTRIALGTFDFYYLDLAPSNRFHLSSGTIECRLQLRTNLAQGYNAQQNR